MVVVLTNLNLDRIFHPNEDSRTSRRKFKFKPLVPAPLPVISHPLTLCVRCHLPLVGSEVRGVPCSTCRGARG